MNGQRVLYLDVCSRPTLGQPAATRVDGRLLALALALLLLITAAGLLYLSQASTLAQLRYQLAGNEQEQAELKEQIALLRCQLAARQSLAGLEARVQELGLVDAAPDDPIMVCYVDAPAGPMGGQEQAAGPTSLAASGRNTLERLLSLLTVKPRLETAQLGQP